MIFTISTYFLVLFCGLFIKAENNNILDYTLSNFYGRVQTADSFVMFYAPWCRHSKYFFPIWSNLAVLSMDFVRPVELAQVDCTVESKLCMEQDVTGYPTLIYFQKGQSKGKPFRGSRDLPSLTDFMSEFLQVVEYPSLNPDVPKIIGGLGFLTDDSFDKYVASGQHFIMFYAPWCSYSQRLAPIWADLAMHYLKDPALSISKVDCLENEITCPQFEIKTFPSLVWTFNGKVMGEYTGERTLDALKNYVARMAVHENHDPTKFLKKNKTSPVAQITEDTFDLYMQKELLFIKYYAPWCAHCKLMVPTWLDLGRKFFDNDKIIIGEVDCSQQGGICEQEAVSLYPTLILYEKGKMLMHYVGPKSLDHLLQFVGRYLKVDAIGNKHDEL